MTADPRMAEAIRHIDALPCPFCGVVPTDIEEYYGHHHSVPTWYVNCMNCDVAIYGKLREGAIQRWNSRPELSFQERVQPWLLTCFGAEVSSDKVERGDRLLEEVLELLQSGGYDPGRVAPLRDYVYGREVGEPAQEVGGVMVTLASYCLVYGLDMHAAGETELARIWTKIEKIRAKQAAKPKHSPLPMAADSTLAESSRLRSEMETMRSAMREAQYRIGARTDNMLPVHKELSINEAWHILDQALKGKEGGI